MDIAVSIYHAGQPILASGANYATSRDLGVCCPFCKESVFLVKAHERQGRPVAAAWRHYKVSLNTSYCESRSLSKEGKAELKALQRPAHNQRLKLFNRRFWDIFKHKKHIPPDLKSCVIRFMGEETLDRMVLHCHKQWNPREILGVLPSQINFRSNNPEIEKGIRQHKGLKNASPEEVEEVLNALYRIKFTALRYKILCETIEWLSTRTALDAFSKLVQLAVIDCLEALKPPIHSSSISQMIIVNLTLTDWEESIEALAEKTKAIGFG